MDLSPSLQNSESCTGLGLGFAGFGKGFQHLLEPDFGRSAYLEPGYVMNVGSSVALGACPGRLHRLDHTFHERAHPVCPARASGPLQRTLHKHLCLHQMSLQRSYGRSPSMGASRCPSCSAYEVFWLRAIIQQRVRIAPARALQGNV